MKYIYPLIQLAGALPVILIIGFSVYTFFKLAFFNNY